MYIFLGVAVAVAVDEFFATPSRKIHIKKLWQMHVRISLCSKQAVNELISMSPNDLIGWTTALFVYLLLILYNHVSCIILFTENIFKIPIMSFEIHIWKSSSFMIFDAWQAGGRVVLGSK